MRVPIIALCAVALLASGCGKKDDAAALDARLGAKADADPALTASLEDQIMVDTTLSSSANDKAIRPPREPAQVPVPPDTPSKPVETGGKDATPTLGSLAAQQAETYKDAFNGCGLNVQYSAGYAAKLPGDLPLYPGARVIEAAGSDQNGCRLRAVTYAAAIAPDQLVDYYVTTARKAGYAPAVKADANGKMVSGRRAADGGAFYVVVQGDGGSATADLVTNNGA